MSNIQQNFNNVMTIIRGLREQNPEMANKLSVGMKSIVGQLLKQLG